MKMKLHQVHLPLARPFTISRGTMTTQSSLYVELEHEGISGFGEVTENSYYGHTFETITASLAKVDSSLLDRYINESPQVLWPEMARAMEGDMFALSALDIAAHDWRGKRLGIPTWQDWGLRWENVPQSSYTIGIDTIETMIAKLQEEPDWGIYKIKLGTSEDLEIVTRLREHSAAVFRVDANCGWSADQTIFNSRTLAELGVEFIEQPLMAEASPADKQKVFAESALPVIADEDCQVQADVAKCHGLYHGVNVKICKCGGLSPALNMLREAKRLGMKTMVGCMIESSVGISGAAQLLPLLDYADLDGAILLSGEPATGVHIQHGQVEPPTKPGCGTKLHLDRIPEFAEG